MHSNGHILFAPLHCQKVNSWVTLPVALHDCKKMLHANEAYTDSDHHWSNPLLFCFLLFPHSRQVCLSINWLSDYVTSKWSASVVVVCMFTTHLTITSTTINTTCTVVHANWRVMTPFFLFFFFFFFFFHLFRAALLMAEGLRVPRRTSPGGSPAEGCTKWKWMSSLLLHPVVIGLVPATAWQLSSRPSHISRQMNASPHKVAQDRIACRTCLSISSMTCQHYALSFPHSLEPLTAVVEVILKWATANTANTNRKKASNYQRPQDWPNGLKSIWLYKKCLIYRLVHGLGNILLIFPCPVLCYSHTM